MKRRLEIIMAVILIVAAAMIAPRSARYVMNMKAQAGKICICIDPGHGGSDPGKVGTNGTKEKDINLILALKLKQQLEEKGYQAVLTRDSDTDLAEENASSKKVSDMKKRCDLIDRAKPAVTISIHQNSYPDSSVSGAQTFYYGSSQEGKLLAECLQESLIKTVDPSNHRMAKANESYYLLKKTSVPIVIVECGFLSNPEEERKLQEDSYQNLLVEAICQGTENYLKEKAL